MCSLLFLAVHSRFCTFTCVLLITFTTSYCGTQQTTAGDKSLNGYDWCNANRIKHCCTKSFRNTIQCCKSNKAIFNTIFQRRIHSCRFTHIVFKFSEKTLAAARLSSTELIERSLRAVILGHRGGKRKMSIANHSIKSHSLSYTWCVRLSIGDAQIEMHLCQIYVKVVWTIRQPKSGIVRDQTSFFALSAGFYCTFFFYSLCFGKQISMSNGCKW